MAMPLNISECSSRQYRWNSLRLMPGFRYKRIVNRTRSFLATGVFLGGGCSSVMDRGRWRLFFQVRFFPAVWVALRIELQSVCGVGAAFYALPLVYEYVRMDILLRFSSSWIGTPGSMCYHGTSHARQQMYLSTVNLGYNELYIPLGGFVKNRYSLRSDLLKFLCKVPYN